MLTLDTGLLAATDDRLEELVILALLIALLDRLERVGALLALAQDHALERKLGALPPLVAVHGVVTADHGGDLADADLLHLPEQLLHVAGAGLGVGVAAVAEEVDVNLGHAGVLSGAEQGVEVLLLGVLSWCKRTSVFTTVQEVILTTPPCETSPHRCSRPLVFLAFSSVFLITSLLANSFLRIVWSMRTTSCHTTRPAPMFRWPTSELPIRPSGRPTAREEASSCVKPSALLDSSSITGVLAAAIASPSLGDCSDGMPQPSITTVGAQKHED